MIPPEVPQISREDQFFPPTPLHEASSYIENLSAIYFVLGRQVNGAVSGGLFLLVYTVQPTPPRRDSDWCHLTRSVRIQVHWSSTYLYAHNSRGVGLNRYVVYHSLIELRQAMNTHCDVNASTQKSPRHSSWGTIGSWCSSECSWGLGFGWPF